MQGLSTSPRWPFLDLQCDARTSGKGNKIMRNAMLAILGLFAAGTATIGGSAPAAAQDYPWCVTGGQLTSGGGDCNYQTLAQCQASAYGRWALYCTENIRYLFARQRAAQEYGVPHRRRQQREY
jgi:hypothetical protein